MENQVIQTQLQTLQRQQNAGPSNFTKNLLVQKDQDISQLKDQLAVERKAKIEAEDQLWHASKDNEIKLLQLGEAEKLKQELSSLNTLNADLESRLLELTRSSSSKLEELKQQLSESKAHSQRQKQLLEAQMDQESGAVASMISQLEEQNESMRREMDEMIAKEERRESAKRELFSSTVAQLEIEPEQKSMTEVGVMVKLEQASSSSGVEMETQQQLEDLMAQVDSHKKDQADAEQRFMEELQQQMQLIEEQQKAADDAQMQIKSLKQQLQQSTNELNEQIRSKQYELQSKEQQIEIMNLEQEQLHQEFERMQSNEKKMIADLQLQRRNNSSTDKSEDAPEQHSKRIDELEAERDLLQSELSGLKEQRQVEAEQTVQPTELDKQELFKAMQTIDLQGQVTDLTSALQKQNFELKSKQSEIDTLEYEVNELRASVSSLTQNEQKLLQEAQELQETVNNELKRKMEQLDLEQEELRLERQSIRNDIKQKQQEFEEALQQKQVEFDLKESQMQSKFSKQIQSIEGEHEDGKESLISNIYEDHQAQIHDLKQAHAEELRKMKTQLEDLHSQAEEQQEGATTKHKEDCEKIRKQGDERLKKVQGDLEREVKKQKDELDRLNKAHLEKISKLQAEFKQESERNDFENREKMEALQQKSKKDVKTTQEKGKAELNNAVDGVKNDMARAKCDWDREKKKLNAEHQNELNMLRSQMEDDAQEEMRLAKEKADKQFKKRLQDKENLWQAKFEEIEQEISDLNEAHRVEIKNEKERWEARLGGQMRSQLKSELTNELEQDFLQRTQELDKRHQLELEKLKTNLREERADRQAQPGLSGAQKETLSQQSQTEAHLEQPTQEKISDAQLSIMQQEIEQIKEQYDQKLQQQLKKNSDGGQPRDIKMMKNEMIKHFEHVLNYEFEKILLSLRMKSQNLSQDELNSKRNDINKQIQKLLYHNKEFTLKKSIDNIKKKISEVLKLFKESLEDKSNKKIQELEKQLQQFKTESDIKKLDQQRQIEVQQSFTLMSEQNASVSKSYQQQNDDLIPSKYISSNSKLQQFNQTNQTVAAQKGEHDEENHILERLEPQMTNSKGQIVVEVEKVFKDLEVLYKSMKASKFFRLCVQNSRSGDMPETLFDVTNEDQPESTPQQELIVKKYRDLLNYFFKLFVKLNNGADQLSRQNEVFRLKLLNQDLREQTFKLKAELNGALTQEKVNQLVGLLTSDQLLMNMLSQDALNVLNKIQELTPNLEKLLDHQRCLVDLFTTENLAVNKNCAEINQKCQIYLEQFDGEEEQQQANEDNMIIDPSATYLDHENMQHYNNDFTIKNSFDQQYIQDYDEQYDQQEQYTNLIDPQNFTQQNMLSSVGGDPNYNPQPTNISQDQAVDLLAQVLQKLNSVQTSQLMNNTQENIMMRPMMHENQSQSIYASQQYAKGQVQAEQRRGSANHNEHQTNNFMLNIDDDRRIDKTMQSMIDQNQTVNEDCIRQAESLLQMFKQGQQANQNQPARGLGLANTATAHLTSISMNNTNDNVRASTKSVTTNLPLQKITGPKQRMGSATATWSRNDTGANNSSIISQQDAQSQQQLQARNMIPRNQQRKQTQQVYHQSENLRSTEQMSSTSAGAFSTQVHQLQSAGSQKQKGHGGQVPPPVPPLQLKLKAGSQTQQKQQPFATSKSMSNFPSNHREQQPPQNAESLWSNQQRGSSLENRNQQATLASAGDYYKYHKKKLMEERRNSQQIALNKIEGVVSPISAKRQLQIQGQSSMQRHDSVHSAQVQLKPPSSTRLNSTQYSNTKQGHQSKYDQTNQFQTVEVDNQQNSMRLGPGLPKSKGQLQVMYDHARRQQNGNFQTVTDDFEELGNRSNNSQQTLTFRTKKLRGQNQDQEEDGFHHFNHQQDSDDDLSQGELGSQKQQWYDDEDDQSVPQQARERVARHTLLSDNDASPANDMDERSSQKETIQLYASREVSNNNNNRLQVPSDQDQQPTKQSKGVRDSSPASQSLMGLKQRMANSSTCSQTSLTKINNRYKQ